MGIPRKPISGTRIRIYIEGDGHAWATRSRPSLDPSPKKTTDSTPGLRRPHARHLPRTTLSAYKDSEVPSAPVDQSSTLRRGGQQPWAGAGSDQATLG